MMKHNLYIQLFNNSELYTRLQYVIITTIKLKIQLYIQNNLMNSR